MSLLLMRHGKSDWSVPGDDIDRPLSPRGRRAARTIGTFLAASGHRPEIAICSPATRAAQTLSLLLETGGWVCPIQESARLYGGGVMDLVDAVRQHGENHGTALVVGHEPTCSEAASRLTGGGSIRMPTGAICRIDFDVDRWSALSEGYGLLMWLVAPRLLAQ